MNRNLLLHRSLRNAVFFSVGFLALFAQVGRAADTLNYFKNYFVTGDYVAAGIGLRGTGVNGFATGAINMSGVPCTGGSPVVSYVPCNTPGAVPADIVAAFLYWETEESASTPSAMNGFFDGNALVGKVLGDPNNPACWSSGGTTGSSSASGRIYRADVLRYLAIDHANNVRLANGSHTVSLPDSGGTGNGNILLTDGATLFVVYRIVVPGQPLFAPLRAVVSYDGAYTLSKFSAPMTQTVAGFYQASASAAAKMTAVSANGQPNFVETLTVNGATLNTSPFTGTAGGRWDNPTFSISLAKDAASYSTQVTSGNNQVCLTFAAIWTSTNVTDTDSDGLLDIWETNGLHLNNQTSPATFGGCSDYPSDPCVNLPAMGAMPTNPDIFVEIDWLHGTDGHMHNPKLDALGAIAATFGGHGINLHFDLGNNYQGLGLPYIVPAAHARGGDVIEESTLLCPNLHTSVCAFYNPPNNYSVLSWKKGFHAIKDGFPALGISAHFDHNRKDIFHYVLFTHALGLPFNPPTGLPKSTSGVADRPGGDLMITLGLWRADDPALNQTGSALVQAGTLMHELGHNMDLSHAGLYRVPNCMPNYPSVMNYLYQTRGLTGSDNKEHIDYSKGLLSALLDEAHLSETASLGALTYRVRFYGPPATGEGTAKAHCDGTPIVPGENAVRLENPTLSTPDWNRNGILDALDYPLDVNFSGSLEDGVGGSKFFVDANDWSSLNLQQIGARLNVHGLSSDIGQTDLGQTDLGQTDLGQTDLGQTDLGQTDLGQTDLGQTDLGQTDLGDVDYDTVISTLDATSSDNPLTATNTIDRITLNWGAPSIGQIRTYNIYRSDPAHPAPALIASVNGTPPATTFNDIVNDFAHSGAACGATSTCYNTTYTYFLTSVDINGTVSGASNNASSEVTHLFVIADNQTAVYGAALPSLTFKIYGDVSGSLLGVSCAFTISPLVPRNVGSYSITCSGPASTLPTDGVTYNATYNDGVAHTPGTLSIKPRPITVTAAASSKTYNGGTNSTAVPAITPGSLAYTDTAMWTESYDNKNAGTTHVMTPAGTVSDGNSGNNYSVTFVTVNTGVINPAPLTITAVTNTKTYDGTTSAAATPIASGLQGSDTVTGLVEMYNTPDAGTGKTLSVSAYTVNDGNSGGNYTVSTKTDTTGVITKAQATINVTPYNVPYDGAAHTATGTAKGLLGESLSGLDLSGTVHTNAGNYTDGWSFAGGTNYNNAIGAVNDIIAKAPQSITFGPLPDQIFGNPPFTVTATASSGLPVTFTATGNCSASGVNGSTITLTAMGSCSVTASQPGGDNYLSATPVTQAFHIAGFTSTGLMGTARSFHTATLLGSGKVLVVGGFSSSGSPLASAELYDPSSKTFNSTENNMPNKAAGHTATLLPSGKVLVVGGGNSSSEIYDPSTNLWSSAGGISGQRAYHTATLLPNGKVLIAGGSDNPGKITNTALLYDPSTGNYTSTGNMTVGRDFHTATLLPNGKVLIAGGRTSGAGSSYTYQATAEIYDPATGTFTAAGSMSAARYGHTAVLFNGKVLIGGGANTAALAGADQYDPSTGTFAATGSLANARQYFTATLFGSATNVSVVEAGGLNSSARLASAEQYQGSAFQSAGNMTAPRAAHTATLLNDGSVLITGGQGGAGTSVLTAELLK